MFKPDRDTPLILPTTVVDCVPVTSPVKLPEKLVAEVDGVIQDKSPVPVVLNICPLVPCELG